MIFNSIGYTILEIPAYFFCAFTGFVVATSAFMILIVNKGYLLLPNLKGLMISVGGLILTARLFGCFSGVYRAIGIHEKVVFETIKNTGIVFYGGLLGMLATYYLCLKSKVVSETDCYVLDVLAVTFPLFHTIARVGCFLSGCCYGKEMETWILVLYTVNINGLPSTAYRIPVQLIEAGCNLVLFFYLLRLYSRKNWKDKHILKRYLLIYSAERFVLEIIRGDSVRGVINGVSFSQVISVIIFVCVITSIVKQRRISDGNSN